MSIRQLEDDNNRQQRYAFFKAWDNIKKLPSSNPDSFWAIASIYGQPFDKRTVATSDANHVWGGYSQNKNVLFTTWNRFYLQHLEDALCRAVPDANVALHYWDETSTQTIQKGLPKSLTDERVQIDDFGNTILNPLLNFKLPNAITLQYGDPKYLKPIGYKTKRYPYSSLMKTEMPTNETQAAKMQNSYINYTKDLKSPTQYLQENIIYHLQNGKKPIKELYKECLENLTYNEFSNTSSAKQKDVISLEEASNEMLLALGGDSQHGLIAGALGDLAVKEMAAFDPLFFLHMSNVDRIFWIWQRKHDKYTVAKPFTISDNANDEGTQPKFGQGPSPTQSGNQKLTMNTHLHPFKKPGSAVASKDCVDIEHQLNYSYTDGSFA